MTDFPDPVFRCLCLPSALSVFRIGLKISDDTVSKTCSTHFQNSLKTFSKLIAVYWSHSFLTWSQWDNVLKLLTKSALCPVSPPSPVAHPPAYGARKVAGLSSPIWSYLEEKWKFCLWPGTNCPAGCCPEENWFCCPGSIDHDRDKKLTIFHWQPG